MREDMIPPSSLRGEAARPFVPMIEGMSASQPATPAPAWAVLLEQFYSQSGHSFPRIQAVDEAQIPEPYKRLLVHAEDMTPTLEKFYAQPVGITVLNFDLQSDFYLREVVLNVAGKSSSPPEQLSIEYGVIRIFLNRLTPAARRRVLEQRRPFGSILREEGIAHSSWPQSFFRVEADARLTSLLRIRQAQELYGRRNILLDASRHALAEVIEILAPVDPARPTS